jgi:hypothetical protein
MPPWTDFIREFPGKYCHTPRLIGLITGSRIYFRIFEKEFTGSIEERCRSPEINDLILKSDTASLVLISLLTDRTKRQSLVPR